MDVFAVMWGAVTHEGTLHNIAKLSKRDCETTLPKGERHTLKERNLPGSSCTENPTV